MPVAITSRGRAGAAAIGLAVTAMGLVPFLRAVNVIETPDSEIHVPRLLAAVLVIPFVLLGAGILLSALGLGAWVWNALGYAAGLIFVTSTAAFLVWVLATGNAGDSAMLGVGPIAVPLPAFIARPFNVVFVSFCALLMIGIAAAYWWHAIRSVRRRAETASEGASP
ncbi:MAG: hypothetical protein HYU41_09335 [Candidatus Rokubacteria bacterium]|nr:hypothetical protein [Candidatus Rokubacteria bacterium]